MFRSNTNKDVSQKAYEQYIYRSYAMLLLLKINIAQNIKPSKKIVLCWTTLVIYFCDANASNIIHIGNNIIFIIAHIILNGNKSNPIISLPSTFFQK